MWTYVQSVTFDIWPSHKLPVHISQYFIIDFEIGYQTSHNKITLMPNTNSLKIVDESKN